MAPAVVAESTAGAAEVPTGSGATTEPPDPDVESIACCSDGIAVAGADAWGVPEAFESIIDASDCVDVPLMPQVLKAFNGRRKTGRDGDEELQEDDGNEEDEGIEVFVENADRAGVAENTFGRGKNEW